MTLDPAAAVLGGSSLAPGAGSSLAPGAGSSPAPGGGDAPAPGAGDEARVRVAALRQWTARRDLERLLHDGPALRVSALVLQLGLLRHRRPVDEREFAAAVEGLQDQLHQVLQELRDVAGRLYPPLLDETGLGPALREAAGRCPVPVRVDATDERFGAAVEGAAYFALLGCLPGGPSDGTGDGARPASGNGHVASVRPIEIVVRREHDDLVALVTGVDACHADAVLDGVRLVGGTVGVDGPAGDPSVDPLTITVRIPCA